ncbi:hypothetical protein AGMMS49531_06950 [Endomicrobiia bacterium]|nr:hypothetical protein AGMMS49531_06950 [Endomicrobiia bacterium]
MKKIVSFLFCLSLFFVAGCAAATISSVKYTSAEYPPPTDASKIEVYSTTTPKKEYIELAEISLSSGRELVGIKVEAARLGADAIILTGPYEINTSTKSSNKSSKNQQSSSFVAIIVDAMADIDSKEVEEVGVRCVAIKFK